MTHHIYGTGIIESISKNQSGTRLVVDIRNANGLYTDIVLLSLSGVQYYPKIGDICLIMDCKPDFDFTICLPIDATIDFIANQNEIIVGNIPNNNHITINNVNINIGKNTQAVNINSESTNINSTTINVVGENIDIEANASCNINGGNELNIEALTINITGDLVKIGDGTAPVLNQNAIGVLDPLTGLVSFPAAPQTKVLV